MVPTRHRTQKSRLINQAVPYVINVNQVLDGLDLIFYILHMPPEIPVATASINGSGNAAILACQIIGLNEGAFDRNLTPLEIL